MLFFFQQRWKRGSTLIASLHKAKFIGAKYLNLIKTSWGKSGQQCHKNVFISKEAIVGTQTKPFQLKPFLSVPLNQRCMRFRFVSAPLFKTWLVMFGSFTNFTTLFRNCFGIEKGCMLSSFPPRKSIPGNGSSQKANKVKQVLFGSPFYLNLKITFWFNKKAQTKNNDFFFPCCVPHLSGMRLLKPNL